MKATTFCLMVLLLVACSENPFEKDQVSGDRRTISGKTVDGARNPLAGVYFWLDGLDVGTFSDRNGDFTLTLPPRNIINSIGAVNGVFDLYCYTINHQLVIKKVFVQDGAVVWGDADVNKNGSMGEVFLPRAFRVKTKGIFLDDLSITAHFWSEGVPVKIMVPHGSLVLLGGVFLRNIDSGKVYVAQNAGPVEPFVETLSMRERILSFHPNVKALGLPREAFEVTPFIFPYYPALPKKLLESLGMENYQMSERFLELCFTCEREIFRVKE